MIAFYYFNTDKEMQKPEREYSDTAIVSQKVRLSPETGFVIWPSYIGLFGLLVYFFWV